MVAGPPRDERAHPPRLKADTIVALIAAYRRGTLDHLPMLDERDVLPMLDGTPAEVDAASTLIEAERVFYPKVK
jgi:hypothetical protein